MDEICQHEDAEKDTAIYADGYCPLCMLSHIAALEARLKEAEEVIKPFAHEDLSKKLSGNAEGEASPVFGRDKALLRLGDFRRARAFFAGGDTKEI